MSYITFVLATWTAAFGFCQGEHHPRTIEYARCAKRIQKCLESKNESKELSRCFK